MKMGSRLLPRWYSLLQHGKIQVIRCWKAYLKVFQDKAIIARCLEELPTRSITEILFYGLLITQQKLATSIKAALEAMGGRWIDEKGSEDFESLEDVPKSLSGDADKSNPIGSPRSVAGLYTGEPAVTYPKATGCRDTLFLRRMLHLIDIRSTKGDSLNCGKTPSTRPKMTTSNIPNRASGPTGYQLLTSWNSLATNELRNFEKQLSLAIMAKANNMAQACISNPWPVNSFKRLLVCSYNP